jgi:hypothetical protein
LHRFYIETVKELTNEQNRGRINKNQGTIDVEKQRESEREEKKRS